MPETVYRSTHLLVKAAHRGGGCCVVTFDSYTDTADMERAAFGESFFAEHGISAIHVVNGRNRWYHEPDWRQAIEAARAAAAHYQRIVTYGSSMGAYAALRFAKHLGAAGALALSPQYSRDPRKVPFEQRWPEHRRGPWLPELSGPLPADVPAIIAYDPAMGTERLHLDRIAREMDVETLSLPHAGHTAAAFLSECGLLTGLVLSVVRGTADPGSIRRLARARRKQTLHYVMMLSHAALESGRQGVAFDLARKATRMAPQTELAWHYLGYLLMRLGRYDEAVAAHRRSAALAPSAPAIQFSFAVVQRRVGDYDGALRTLLPLSAQTMPREARRKVVIMLWRIRALRLLARAGASLRP